MTTTIQVVENSDRFHVSEDLSPILTILYGVDGITKQRANEIANSKAYELATRRTDEGFRVKLLKQAVK